MAYIPTFLYGHIEKALQSAPIPLNFLYHAFSNWSTFSCRAYFFNCGLQHFLMMQDSLQDFNTASPSSGVIWYLILSPRNTADDASPAKPLLTCFMNFNPLLTFPLTVSQRQLSGGNDDKQTSSQREWSVALRLSCPIHVSLSIPSVQTRHWVTNVLYKSFIDYNNFPEDADDLKTH